jgi:cytoskeletal protein CcmA (bactofilin family)
MPEVAMDQTETIIDGQASFDGTLTGKNVRIMGTYRGEIHLSGRLHLSDGSRVEATVVADAAEIGGEFRGEMKVRIAMREGAQLNGPVNVGGAKGVHAMAAKSG